jgi:Mrp family chromosome partitioning ATPase
VEGRTKVPVLGVIGNNNKATALVALQHPKSVISEAFRSLRTNMQYINPGQEKQVVMVTSSISGEGKTFISTNIASILSLSGKKTVLIGMDLRKPKIFNDFGLTNHVQLFDRQGREGGNYSAYQLPQPGLDPRRTGPAQPFGIGFVGSFWGFDCLAQRTL